MADLLIDHDRPGCIGCGACAAINPKHWVISSVDGKSDVIGAEKVVESGEVVQEKLDLAQEDHAINTQAAECCPVNVIHIVDKRTGERLI